MTPWINQALQFLTYAADQPLIFTQLAFWVFYACVLLVFGAIHPRQRLRNAFLFIVSVFFYYKTSGFFFTILLFSTITDFFIGKRIFSAVSQTGKKVWVAVSITLNLLVLGYFKYAYFFTDSFNALLHTDVAVYNHFAHWSNGFFGTAFRADRILLPVGISFFTFQTMSYALDIYRGHIRPVKNMLDFGFYVSFFPQLVAGPIVRAADFIPQLYQPYRLSKEESGRAWFWIFNGLLKKMILADYLAVNFIDRVFANPGSFSGFEAVLALFGYSLQVYADFSGYTDMAIGFALLLGFRLPMNFNSPYKAAHVGEFWKRWHISLSSWLKDYLYIPMGGNRRGSAFSYIMVGVILLFVSLMSRTIWVPIAALAGVGLAWLGARRWPGVKQRIHTNINLMLTMTLGGLWHGASWSMVIWGALNGLGLMIYKGSRNFLPWRDHSRWYNRAWSIAVTLTFITFTRVWFRGENPEKSKIMLQQIGNHMDWGRAPAVLSQMWPVFSLMGLGYLIHWLPEAWKEQYRLTFIRLPYFGKIAVGVGVFIAVYQVMSAELQPFIYFAF